MAVLLAQTLSFVYILASRSLAETLKQPSWYQHPPLHPSISSFNTLPEMDTPSSIRLPPWAERHHVRLS